MNSRKGGSRPACRRGVRIRTLSSRAAHPARAGVVPAPVRTGLSAGIIFLVALLCLSRPAMAQSTPAATANVSVSIATGGTFQVLSVPGTPQRRSLILQNNNTNSDSCWLFIGAGAATKATAILLGQGASYSRQFPYIPSDAIQVTCTTTGDTLFVNSQ
jgi:hypothetical protein